MAADDSFKKAGAIPFKWEIRPGVPKVVPTKQHFDHSRSFPGTPQRLRPPPSRSNFSPPEKLYSRSISRCRTESRRFNQFKLAHAETVSAGCFSTPLVRRKERKKGAHKPEPKYGPWLEPNNSLDVELTARWSVSTRESLSPFRSSPFDSLSPRPMSDVEWAGFGLF